MNWLTDFVKPKLNSLVNRKDPPSDLWTKCGCGERMLYVSDLKENLHVCSYCDQHMYIDFESRFKQLFDDEKFDLIEIPIENNDPLKFKDLKKYSERIADASSQTGETDALIIVAGCIKSIPVVVSCFEFEFMGGSMGSVVGEKFVRGVEHAIKENITIISEASSGGARMQEGLLSLMQMAKTTAAIEQLNEKKIPFISILTDPTMGGVSASFAFVADLVLAEPKALIGFAGPRVIEQTVRETLPVGFQRSEFLLEKGAIDLIVDRREMREKIYSILSLLLNNPLETLKKN